MTPFLALVMVQKMLLHTFALLIGYQHHHREAESLYSMSGYQHSGLTGVSSKQSLPHEPIAKHKPAGKTKTVRVHYCKSISTYETIS